MLDKHPSEEVEDDTDGDPDGTCSQGFGHSRVGEGAHIEPTEQGKENDVVKRMPWLGFLVAFAHAGSFFHRAVFQHHDIKDGVHDSDDGHYEIGHPEP